MKRILVLCLACALCSPAFARAKRKVKPKHKPAATAPASTPASDESESEEAQPAASPAESDTEAKPAEEAKPAIKPEPAASAKSDANRPEPVVKVETRKLQEPGVEPTYELGAAPSTVAFAGAGFLAVGGFGMSYWAQGQALRARTLSGAREFQTLASQAQQSAATANLFYVLAGASAAYGVVLLFLPPEVRNRATLMFQF